MYSTVNIIFRAPEATCTSVKFGKFIRAPRKNSQWWPVVDDDKSSKVSPSGGGGDGGGTMYSYLYIKI